MKKKHKEQQASEQAALIAKYEADVPIEEVTVGAEDTIRMVARRMARGYRRVSTKSLKED